MLNMMSCCLQSRCRSTGIAEEVLQLSSLDHATKAIKELCHSELVALTKSGVFDRHRDSGGSLLWSILTMMARYFYIETQSVEGLNSIVKLIGRRCPNISLELLSSRLTIKRMLGQADGVIGCRKKWSNIKAFAERKLLQLTDHSTTCLQVLCDERRWATPESVQIHKPAAIADMPSAEKQRPGHETRSLTLADQRDRRLLPVSGALSSKLIDWAKSYNLGWKWTTGGGKRKSKKPAASGVKLQHNKTSFGIAILPTPDLQDEAFYLVVDYFSHSVSFARLKVCRRRAQPGDPLQDCVFWDPDRSSFPDAVESTVLFAMYHEACCVHKQKVPVESCLLSAEMCEQMFMSPGFLPVTTVRERSVHLFEMSSARMKGAPQPKQPKAKEAPQQQQASAAADAAPPAMDPAAADFAYLNGAEGADDLHDIGSDHSCSDHDDPDEAAEDKEFKDDAAAATARTTKELMQAVSSRKSLPTARQVARATEEIASSGCTAPNAEMQEEALLLLIRQRNDHKSQTSQTVRLEGVGDAVGSEQQQQPKGGVDSDSDDVDDEAPLAVAASHAQNSWVLESFPVADDDGEKHHDICVLTSWADACISVMAALRQVHAQQEGKELGENRSVSLVQLRPERVDGCKCVRCHWNLAQPGDLPDIIWVSWLNNSPSYGVTGRRARQVLLDAENKIIFSTAHTTLAKTGISGGLGQPEILCDKAHCDVLIKWVGGVHAEGEKNLAPP